MNKVGEPTHERALAHGLRMALRRYRGGAETDDGRGEKFMAALAARFVAATEELDRPHTGRVGST